MPTYEYACSSCGSFTAVRPLAEFQEPQPCPQCAVPAPRVTLSGPALKGLFSRTASVPGESARPAPSRGCYHGMGGCSCC
jgi:putative FmdB family regulatory protein